MNRVEDLTKVLARLAAGTDVEKIKTDHKDLIASLKPKDIALAGMSLLDAGMYISDFCKLCRNYLSVIGDPVVILFKESNNPILKRIFSQHRELLQIFTQLEQINTEIKAAAAVSIASPEYKKFISCYDQLSIFIRHCEFEHNVVLNEVEESGNESIARLMKHQHLDIKQCYTGLGELAKGVLSDVAAFKSKLNAITLSIVPFGRMHIAVEEAILYPVAAEVITNPDVWEKYWLYFDQAKQSA